MLWIIFLKSIKSKGVNELRGIGMNVLSVPVDKGCLTSGVAQGVVFMEVCAALPLKGVSLVLGNDQAGSTVWPDGPMPTVVRDRPFPSVEPTTNLRSKLRGTPFNVKEQSKNDGLFFLNPSKVKVSLSLSLMLMHGKYIQNTYMMILFF